MPTSSDEKKKNPIKRIFTFCPSDVIVESILLTGLVLALIPLYRLCAYAIPYCDDYDAFANARDYMKSSSDFPGAIRGSAFYAWMSWHKFQGTFTSKFFMAFSPFVFDSRFYGWGCVFLISILVIAVFALVRTVATDIFDARDCYANSLATLSVTAVVLFIYSAQQGFYWYDSGMHYIFMHSLLMLLIAAMIRMNHPKGRIKAVPRKVYYPAILAAFIISGGNYVTLVQAFISITVVYVLICIRNKKISKIHIPVLIVFLIGAGFNVTAPGNAVRAGLFESEYHTPVKAILKSFTEGGRFLARFTDWRTLLLFSLMIPVIWKMVGETKYVFKTGEWLGLIAFSIALYCSGFTPMLYSTGRVDLSRVINAIKITFHILIVLNMIYTTGIIRKSAWCTKHIKWQGGVSIWLVPLWLAAWVFFFNIQPDPIGSYSSWGANHYLTTGQAESFRTEYRQRLEMFEGPEKDIVLEPYTVFPWFMGWQDFSTDPSAEQNVFAARYYGKTSIRVRETGN